MSLVPTYLLIFFGILLIGVTLFLFFKKKRDLRKQETQRKDHRDMLMQIVEAGGYNVTDNFGNTPLILSVRFAFEDIFLKVIDHPINLNASDSEGYTAMHFAAALNNVKALTLLTEKGANINTTSRINDTPIMLAVRTKAFAAVKYLLEQKVDLTILNQNNQPVFEILEHEWFNEKSNNPKEIQAKEDLRNSMSFEFKLQTLPS